MFYFLLSSFIFFILILFSFFHLSGTCLLGGGAEGQGEAVKSKTEFLLFHSVCSFKAASFNFC